MRPFLVLGCAALILSGCASTPPRPDGVKRVGMVTTLKPEKIEEYVDLHASTWPGVLQAMTECNIHNFSIYLAETEPGKHHLFAYFEYRGSDFDADMARMQTYPINQEWWELTDACQQAVPLHAGPGPWMSMEEVFHSE
jgi:L-rhamnose mutarotase